VAPDHLLKALLLAERVVLGQHRQLKEAQLVARLPQLGGDVAQLPHARRPLRGPHRAKELDLVQREQQLVGECLLRFGQQPPDLLRLLGDDLVDPTLVDLAVQRRRQQMALAKGALRRSSRPACHIQHCGCERARSPACPAVSTCSEPEISGGLHDQEPEKRGSLLGLTPRYWREGPPGNLMARVARPLK
jgi:hypothetical protein